MNAWLRRLLLYKRPFPIPIRTVGAEAVFEARTNPKGTVLLSVHLPLGHLMLNALVDMGCPPSAVLAKGDLLRAGMLPVWGRVEELPGITPDGNVLLKVRSILRRGGLVATMINSDGGAPLSGNVLRLVGSTGARAVFVLIGLQSTGELLVEFHTPPDPFCSSKEGILKNLAYFQHKIDDLERRSFEASPEFRLRTKEMVLLQSKQEGRLDIDAMT